MLKQGIEQEKEDEFLIFEDESDSEPEENVQSMLPDSGNFDKCYCPNNQTCYWEQLGAVDVLRPVLGCNFAKTLVELFEIDKTKQYFSVVDEQKGKWK